MLKQHNKSIKEIVDHFGGYFLSIVTSSSCNSSYSLDVDIIPVVNNHLTNMPDSHQLLLFLESSGGDIHVPLRLIELIRSYVEKLIVIVVERAYSSATLLSLGCDKIYMSRQASLTPIDPSICIEYNDNGKKGALSFNTGDILAILDYISKHTNKKMWSQALSLLSKEISPTLLGKVLRNYEQCKLIGRKTINYHFKGSFLRRIKSRRIINSLIAKYHSHNYLLNAKELKKMGIKAYYLNSRLETNCRQLLVSYRKHMSHSNISAIVEDEHKISSYVFEKDHGEWKQQLVHD